MFIVLPDDRDGLRSIEDRIALSDFETITAGLHQQTVRVKLPKFKIEKEINLRLILPKVSFIFS